MKKIFLMVCMFAAIAPVAFAADENSVEVEMDSAKIAYLKSIDDVRFCDSVMTGMYGPTRRVYYQVEIPNEEDTTKIDTVSLTKEIQKLYGWQFVIGVSASGIADGMTYYDKSIGDHFTFRPELVFGLEGRQLGFGDNILSNRVNCGIYGRIYMTEYSPKSTSAGKKYLSGALETYLGYDILGTREGIHVLSVGPTFGLEMQRMDSVLNRELRLAVVDQAWNINFGLRVQYNAIIPKSGTSFSGIVGIRFAQVKAVNQTDWTVQLYGTIQLSQLFKTRIAKSHINKRNKEVENVLNPKDK
jgi:hypothetical protein